MPDVNVLTDSVLSEQLRSGSHEAYSEIYARYFGLLFIAACKKVSDREDARDLVHETFTNLWDKRKNLNPEMGIASYLYASLRNRIINWFAHQQVSSKYVTSFRLFYESGICETDHKIREKQLATLIEKEIDALPPRMKEVFLLSRRAHLSHREIATQLDISEQTVKTQIKHTLRILRARLGLMLFILMLTKI